MPNEFSIEIHNHISTTLEAVEARLARARNTADSKEIDYCQGQIDELAWIRKYLREHVDLKGFAYYDPMV